MKNLRESALIVKHFPDSRKNLQKFFYFQTRAEHNKESEAEFMIVSGARKIIFNKTRIHIPLRKSNPKILI